MSIVEKALGKAQGKTSGETADQLLDQSSRGGDVHRLPPREEPKLHARIHVDRNNLIALRMTPPAEHQLRLTNELRRVKRPLLEPLLAKPADGAEAVRREIIVTSSVPNEGKTFITLNLALSIASEKDCKVLLVDGDLAKPHLTALFGQTDQPGLTDLLADEASDPFDFVLDTDVEGLWFLPAGKMSPNAPELVASRRMRQFCKIIAARDPRRIVLFDSPPVLASNEAQALSSHIQNILVVVRADFTPPDTLSDTLRVLGEKRISCILNRAPQSTTSPFYGTYGVYGSNSS
jgi:capsular exopolysaccharide synthesis family protein